MGNTHSQVPVDNNLSTRALGKREDYAIRKYCQANKPQVVKIILVGLPSTGKSTLIRNYCLHGTPPEPYDVNPSDNYRRLLIKYDTPIAVDFDALQGLPSGENLHASVRGFDACLLLYATTERGSFEALRPIVNELSEFQSDSSNQRVLVVVGNSEDVPGSASAIGIEEGNSFARDIGARFVQVSGESGNGVSELVDEIVKRVILARTLKKALAGK